MKTYRRTAATINHAAKQAAASISSDPTTRLAESPTANTHKKVTHIPKNAAIVVKYNAGWGNMLYVHGEGENLKWEKGQGTPMTNISEDYWVWTPPTKNHHGAINFKITINNGEAWSDGNNIELKPGEKIAIEPKFPASR